MRLESTTFTQSVASGLPQVGGGESLHSNFSADEAAIANVDAANDVLFAPEGIATDRGRIGKSMDADRSTELVRTGFNSIVSNSNFGLLARGTETLLAAVHGKQD